MNAGVRLLTPEGVGGIAVIELSGARAEDIIVQCFRSPSKTGPTGQSACSAPPLWGAAVKASAHKGAGLQSSQPAVDRPASETWKPAPGRIAYGHIVCDDEVLDEVLVACVPTGDDAPVFEINCHGGIVPARRVLRRLVELGADVHTAAHALPTLEDDLFRQLVNARTHRAADVLLAQLAGRLRAELEAVVASPERLGTLQATWAYGRRLTHPATVVITGAPNVGKSTLANALVGRERSIVHHLPGTTRDAVTAVASLDGLPVVLVDTAGLREAAGEIERIGVTKALERAGRCDLVVWVFDHSRRVTDDETRYLAGLRDMPLVPVVNKIDLDGPLEAAEVERLTGSAVERACALTGRGVDALRTRLFRTLLSGDVPAPDAPVVTLERVAHALDEAASKRDTAPLAGLLADEETGHNRA